MNAQSLLRTLNASRTLVRDDLTVQALMTLLAAAEGGASGVEMETLCRRANLKPSAASKNVADLTNLTSKKRRGPGLVTCVPDPMNLRTRVVTLTPAGAALVAALLGGKQ